MSRIVLKGENVKISKSLIESDYLYCTTHVRETVGEDGHSLYEVTPQKTKLKFKTERTVPKTGVMFVGWGGNNGTTFTAVALANKHKMSWKTRTGVKEANFYGSLVKSSTMCLGVVPQAGSYNCRKVSAPLCDILPFLDTDSLEIDGWDINNMNLADAVARAQVLEVDLQEKLYPFMKDLKPRPSIYNPDFIAMNQGERANNVLEGTLHEQLEQIRADIRQFKEEKALDKVIVMWTASTERFTILNGECHASADTILKAIERDNKHDISPSTLFAVASILEGCSFINGAPQNTIYRGVLDLAAKHNVFVAGDDFKTGQTKIKSCLVEFLLGSGVKPVSIVSYNHLGNNDGRNLDSYKQFRSKEITKKGVIEEMIESNSVLYKEGEKPDHCIVIKYIPYVGDSKRAMDEYTSEICMHGTNTLVIHNTCEDSLLACMVMLDLVLLCEFFQRVKVKLDDGSKDSEHGMQTVMSALSFLLKAPLTNEGEPLVNAFHAQKSCIENIARACLGIPPENHMFLEHKFKF